MSKAAFDLLRQFKTAKINEVNTANFRRSQKPNVMSNAAFDLLRQFKPVNESVEEIVLKKVRFKYPGMKVNELVTIFEKGITGDFGKYFDFDPQVLLSWIDASGKSKNAFGGILGKELLNPETKMTDLDYPPDVDGWQLEVNKCYNSFLSGTPETSFHPNVYDRLVMDGRVEKGSLNAYMENPEDPNQAKGAKQKATKDFFEYAKSRKLTTIY